MVVPMLNPDGVISGALSLSPEIIQCCSFIAL